MSHEPYPSLPRTIGLLGATLALAGGLAVAAAAAFPDWPALLRTAVPTELALLAVVAWAVRRTGAPWREAVLLRRLEPRVLPALGLVLVGAVTVFSELYVLVQKLAPIPPAFERALEELLEISGPVDLATTVGLAVLVAPLLEEALFRGVLLRGLAARRGPRSATVWTAFFFALFHLYNPWQIVPTFFLGLLLGWIVLATRTLLAGVLVHAGFNAVSLGLFALALEDIGGADDVAWLVAGIVAILLLGSVALLAGMAWVERLTGGGWFEPGGRDPLEEEPVAAGYLGENAGPSTARG